jgi:cyanate permease
LLADHSIGWTYLLASMAAVCISGLVFYLPRWVHPEKILQKKLPSTDDDNE